MMKRIVFLFISMLLSIGAAQAIPAYPGVFKVKQPDGTTVSLRQHGDEWMHFTTTADGYTVVKDARGYYVYAELKDGRLQATAQVVHDAAVRTQSEQTFLAAINKYQVPAVSPKKAAMRQAMQERQAETRATRRATGFGNFRGLIILVEYNDCSFSRKDINKVYTDMVNQEGYTGFGGQKFTGSVRDYFSDNSNGKFVPQFDVVGPYKVDFSQYDAQGGYEPGDYGYDEYASSRITYAAIEAADADGVNFKSYDGDGNGYVDLIYFIFAGAGSHYGNNNPGLWWPHRWVLFNPANPYSTIRKDGVRLYDYASSVEMAGYTSYPSTMMIDGIGTICHEFSHVLGLPDFYDTDYEKSGGESDHPGEWSLMAGGSYMNDSRTPVGYSLYERYSVGFCDAPATISAEGSYELEPLNLNGKGYRIDSNDNNEFFLLENRQKSAFKWDAYLPGSGLLVHRVDQSNTDVWSDNTINNDPSHNYYEVVRAGGSSHSGTGYDVFPGTGHVTELSSYTSPASLRTWSGEYTEWGLSDISVKNGVVSFNVGSSNKLQKLSLPRELTVGEGMTAQLVPTAVPSRAVYTLTWSSDNEQVATVDADGRVTGVSEGTCTISCVSDNGVTASCTITVGVLQVYTPDELDPVPVGEAIVLQLTDAEVLFTYGNQAYLRDTKGCVMFSSTGIDLKPNDVVNGTVRVQLDYYYGIPVMEGIDQVTNAANLTIVEGDEVQPREVAFSELSPDNYGDYILVKGVRLERDNGIWAFDDGDQRVKLYNTFDIDGISVPLNLDNKRFDVCGILVPRPVGKRIILQIEMLKSPVETGSANPTAIREVSSSGSGEADDDAYYNLNGQRVSATAKGLLIHRGRKVIR